MGPVVELAEEQIKNSVWLSCSESTRTALLERGGLRRFEAGQMLLREGDYCGFAIIPLTGKLQLSKSGRGGRRQVLCKLDPEKCGGPCLLTVGEQSLADVRAVEPSIILTIGREDLEDLAVRDQALGHIMLHAVMHCMSHFVNAMGNLSFNKVAKRVALALLDATDGDDGLVRQTQAELAAEVGTTREVVARCLAELQEGGMIKLGRGRIRVLDRDQLQTMV